MLTELHVRALGVIDRAEISLAGGSSALTGETGAGKTLLVAAMGLLLGGRADRTLVRDQASEALVEGRFVLPAGHDAVVVLVERGVVAATEEDVEVVVSRTVSADGRGKARVNGRLVPLSLLAEIGPTLVEIAGQHEHHRLGSASYQRAILDAYCGPETMALAGDVRRLVRDATSARRDLEELRRGARERERELDILRYEAQEISAVDPTPGESERLSGDARRLEHAATIAEGVEGAVGSLTGDAGAGDQVAAAIDALRHATEHDPTMAGLAARLDAVAIEINDVAGELATRIVEPDPQALEETRSRLEALGRLRRKYGSDDAEVLDHLERARNRIAELEAVDEGLDLREQRVAELEERAAAAAGELHARRSEAVGRLVKELVEALADLTLPDARVEVDLDRVPLYEGGVDEVSFLISLNRGEALRPLTKVASGGELSRLSLALGLLTTIGAAPTMVFDEVDAGVGGATAHSIGRALAGLARERDVQVLVVTHLPQVAAFADHHFRIRKSVTGDRTSAAIEPLTDEARVDELSRMLAGMPESDRAREHAQELLELAGEARP